MPVPGRRRFGSESSAVAALAFSVLAVCCAGVQRRELPVPTSGAIASSSTSPSAPAPTTSVLEADFVVDSSTTVKASVDEIRAMLLSEGSLTHVLPYTRSAVLVGAIEGNERHVRLVQGTSLINVEYTLLIRDEGPVLRFQLEKQHPHGIGDTQGFFELIAEAPDRTRVRFVDAVDLGGGVARLLFKEQIRKSATTTPTLVREFMESRQARQAPPTHPAE